jgi:hypothetical protein
VVACETSDKVRRQALLDHLAGTYREP